MSILVGVWGAKTRGSSLRFVAMVRHRDVVSFFRNNREFYACLEAAMPNGQTKRITSFQPKEPESKDPVLVSVRGVK